MGTHVIHYPSKQPRVLPPLGPIFLSRRTVALAAQVYPAQYTAASPRVLFINKLSARVCTRVSSTKKPGTAAPDAGSGCNARSLALSSRRKTEESYSWEGANFVAAGSAASQDCATTPGRARICLPAISAHSRLVFCAAVRFIIVVVVVLQRRSPAALIFFLPLSARALQRASLSLTLLRLDKVHRSSVVRFFCLPGRERD